MLFGKKQQPLLGLDITTSSVKLIELSQSGKRYRVESYSAEPTPPSSVSEKAIVDAKAVGEAIRRGQHTDSKYKDYNGGFYSTPRSTPWILASQPDWPKARASTAPKAYTALPQR